MESRMEGPSEVMRLRRRLGKPSVSQIHLSERLKPLPQMASVSCANAPVKAPMGRIMTRMMPGSANNGRTWRCHQLRCSVGQLMSSARGAGATLNRRCMIGLRLACAAMAAASCDRKVAKKQVEGRSESTSSRRRVTRASRSATLSRSLDARLDSFSRRLSDRSSSPSRNSTRSSEAQASSHLWISESSGCRNR